MASLPVRHESAAEREKDAESAVHRDKDERAVEKLLFLKLRDPSPTVGSLLACGAGGWVQAWNTSGGGLVGEFNVWDTRRHTLPKAERQLHSVTAMHGNETETVLLTGNSLGYLQLWDISSYCLDKGCEEDTPTVDKTPPPLKLAWRSHISSIVSIDTAEEVGVIVTASTDCTVRLWTTRGRYIGTFGQRAAWQVPLPPPDPRGPKIMALVPPDLHRCSSFETMQTISGAVRSKWTLGRNLLRALRGKGPPSSPDDGDHAHQEPHPPEDVLGCCYERRTRVRQEMKSQPLRQREVGTFPIYSSLTCPELAALPQIQPPSQGQPQSVGLGGGKGHGGQPPAGEGVWSRDGGHTHTEASLLQGVWQQQRRSTVT
jgi:hypothetical protein